MKINFLLLGVLMTLSSCKKAEEGSVDKKAGPAKPETGEFRRASEKKAHPRELGKILKDWGPNTPSLAREFVEKYGKENEIGSSKAWEEVYEDLAKGLTQNEAEVARIQISSILVKDSPDAASIIGGMSAGELRSSCISLIKGSEIAADKIGTIYHSLPESKDKNDLRGAYVTKTFYEKGFGSAVSAIDSMDSDQLKRDSVIDLAQYASTSYPVPVNLPPGIKLPERRTLSEMEKKSMLEYADKVGGGEAVRKILGGS